MSDVLTPTEALDLHRVAYAGELACEAMQQVFHNGLFYDGLSRQEAAEYADELVSAAETLVDELQTMIGTLQPFTKPLEDVK